MCELKDKRQKGFFILVPHEDSTERNERNQKNKAPMEKVI
jgi:hypothetical protein